MKRVWYGIVLFTVAILATPSHACLNDRDTLAEEVKGLPDVVQVITGRFERNPPLFYQMRLERVGAELRAHPTLLSDYDDAGVACDRMGRDDEALAWMQKKRIQLAGRDASDPAVREQWYRYDANTGTFRVHRWLRAGADRRRVGEVSQARAEIARAIVIKPNAHSGREKYQLLVMTWLIASTKHPKKADAENDLFMFMSEKTTDAEATTKGLCGLTVLGNAWESADIFEALAFQLDQQEKFKLAFLADLRARELRHMSLHPQIQDGMTDLESVSSYYRAVSQASGPQLEQWYPQLRAEAERWQQQRTAYMMTRLQTGHHPDTDPLFWNAYHDAGPPKVVISPPISLEERWRRGVTLVSVSIALLGAFAYAASIRMSRRRRVSVADEG